MNLLLSRVATAAALCCSVIFVFTSLHWEIVGDASLMHYVVLLMHRGMLPYKDIIDVNLPGTYAVEWLVVNLFGPGNLGWRLYDVGLGCFALVAMSILSYPAGRLAGPFAGAVFFLLHGRDGVAELGQRDLLMTAAMLWAAALLFLALRTEKLWQLAAGAAVAGFAISVKPTAFLFWIAMLGVVMARREYQRWGMARFLAGALPGVLIVPLVAVRWLQGGGLDPFWQTVTTLIPYHNSLFRLPMSYFIVHTLPSALIPWVIAWAVLLLFRLMGKLKLFSLEEEVLLACALCGSVSFALQGKGYSYHRYPMTAFLVLLITTSTFTALGHRGSYGLRAAALISVVLGGLVLAPKCLQETRTLGVSQQDFSHSLRRDLDALGGQALDGKVQCVDFTAGCISTLSSMHLAQSTGWLYNCYALDPDSNRMVQTYRRRFERSIADAMPEVIVVSDQYCGHPGSFDKLHALPEIEQLLIDRYTLSKEVTPSGAILWARQRVPSSRYRIYLRRGAATFPVVHVSQMARLSSHIEAIGSGDSGVPEA